MNLCFYKALESLPQGITVALEFLGPLTLAIIQSRRATDFLWAGLAAIGMYMLIPDSFANLTASTGIFYALSAGLFWALYIFFGQKTGKSALGTKAIAWGMCLAALITTPFGVAHIDKKLFQVEVLSTMLGVALLSSVIPYSLELSALKKISTKSFAILMSLEPAVASLAGLIFMKESLSRVQLLAITAISFASMGTTFLSNRKMRASPIESV